MWNECKDLQEYIVGLRRDLHQIPELGLHLPETAAYVTAELDKIGIPYICSKKDSGIIATIKGGKPGKTICLRADMDALPIKEETGLPFASRHEGFMHACGHDTHTAMLLGAGKVLWAHKDEIAGTVRLMFQTSEEQSRGAEVMIENGGERYEVGKGTVLELNSSQVSLTQAQLTYNQSIYDYLVSKADLDQVLGKQ